MRRKRRAEKVAGTNRGGGGELTFNYNALF